MYCPRCNHEDTKVLETRLGKGNHSIRRRRECLACGHRFSTMEEIVREGLVVVKRNGAREEFDIGKIASGVRKATVDQIAYVRFASVYREFRDIDELAKAIDQLRKGGKVK